MVNLGINSAKTFSAYLKTSGRSFFATKPVKIDTNGLKYIQKTAIYCFLPNIPKSLKGMPANQLAELKPSQFKRILSERSDILPKISAQIGSPDKLALYDDVIDILKRQKLSEREMNDFFTKIFQDTKKWQSLPDVSAKREIIPKLLEKGYEAGFLSRLPITHFNKNQVESIISKEEELFRLMNGKGDIKLFRMREIPEIIRYIDDNNAKYLTECLELTKQPQNLIFFNAETSKIIKELCAEPTKSTNILERIFRQNLSFSNVKEVAQGVKLLPEDYQLLEFKGFGKLKNIGLQEINQLSIEEKKNLLEGFTNAIHPSKNIPKNIEYLASRMKIFRDLSVKNVEEFNNDYFKTIRTILDSLPEKERILAKKSRELYKGADYYLQNNPIPSLVDDIQKLPYKETIINGKKVKIVEISKDSELNLAIHQFSDPRAILNMEAVEIANPNAYLCTGLRKSQKFDDINEVFDFVKNGKKAQGLHFDKGKWGVALKPQQNTEFFVQGGTDIWSDGLTKTPYNLIRGTQAHLNDKAASYVPELLKKELNLSQKEYNLRLEKIKGTTTLDEVEKIDFQLANAIRKVTKDFPMYEGIVKPQIMGVCVDSNIALNQLPSDIVNYCALHENTRLIRVLGY